MENKNGQGIFYGVIGVATLVVAIIGATFAYFSASVSAGNNGEITGQTLGGTEGGVLSLTVEKIVFSSTTASSLDLVPTNITTSNAQTAVTNKCEAAVGGGDTTVYTGCHLYRIVVEAGSDIQSAVLKLDTFTPTAKVAGDWNYSLWKSTDAKTATTYTLGNNVAAATGTGAVASAQAKTVDTTALTKATPIVYYMLVYVADDNAVQNDGGDNDATGSYTGTFTLEAAGGSTVKATFTA